MTPHLRKDDFLLTDKLTLHILDGCSMLVCRQMAAKTQLRAFKDYRHRNGVKNFLIWSKTAGKRNVDQKSFRAFRLKNRPHPKCSVNFPWLWLGLRHLPFLVLVCISVYEKNSRSFHHCLEFRFQTGSVWQYYDKTSFMWKQAIELSSKFICF